MAFRIAARSQDLFKEVIFRTKLSVVLTFCAIGSIADAAVLVDATQKNAVSLAQDVRNSEGYTITKDIITSDDLLIKGVFNYAWKIVKSDDGESIRLIYERRPDAEISLSFYSIQLSDREAFEEWVCQRLTKVSVDPAVLITEVDPEFTGLSKPIFTEEKLNLSDNPEALEELKSPAQPSPFRAQSIEFLRHDLRGDGSIVTTLGVFLRFQEQVAYLSLNAHPDRLLEIRKSLYKYLCVFNIVSERYTMLAPEW